MKYIDLTRVITNNMPVYPGDMEVQIKSVMDLQSTGIANQSLNCSMHVGTHIDSPSHMILDGKRLTDFDVSKFIGNGKLIDARGQKQIDKDLFLNKNIEPGDIVVILTNYDKNFYEKNFFSSYPAITQSAAEYLVSRDIKMIGMDTPSPDYPPFSTHKIFMAANILIIENLTNLETLIDKDFEIIALPIKTETDGAIARVVAKIK